MGSETQEKSLVETLKENDLSIDVLGDETHPDFAAQSKRLTRIIQSGKITEWPIDVLSGSTPSATVAFKSVAEGAKEAQTKLIEAFKEKNSDAYTVIEKIVERAETEALRREALNATVNMSKSDSETMQGMNDDNNKLFKHLAGAVVIGLILIAGGLAAKSHSK